MVSQRTVDMIRDNYLGKRIIFGYGVLNLLQGKLLKINDENFLIENTKILENESGIYYSFKNGKLEEALEHSDWKNYSKKAILSTKDISSEAPICEIKR